MKHKKPIPKAAIGERIRSIEEIAKLAERHKSVIVPTLYNGYGPYYLPARRFYNYSCEVVVRCLKYGVFINKGE